MKEKYTPLECCYAFCDCVEAGEKLGESDDFACRLHLKVCPDYERLSEHEDDPMYIGFLNIPKSRRRYFIQQCRKYIERCKA